MKKILERLKKVFGGMKVISGKILVSVIGILFFFLIIWLAFRIVKTTEEKKKITPIPTTVEIAEKETSEKKTQGQIVIENLVQGDVYNQESKTTQVHPAKEVKPIKKAKTAEQAIVKKEKTKEVKVETKEEPNEIDRLKTKVAELEYTIWSLQMETDIRELKNPRKINTQIAELTAQLAESRAEIRYLESQMYAQQEPQVEVIEHHYYRDYAYFLPYGRLCFLNLWAYYPYYINPFSWHYPYYSQYYGGYYSSDYYPSGYYTHRTAVSKNQLRNPRTRTTLSASQLRSSVKTATSAKLSRVSKRGVRIDPIYTLPRSQRPSQAKLSSPKGYQSRPSKLPSLYRIKSTTQPSRISSRSFYKAPSRSLSKSSRTPRTSKGKVRKK